MDKKFRCTRQAPYSDPGCPGHKGLGARQGHYIYVKDGTAEMAHAEMARRFPEDVKAGFGFDIQYWGQEV